MPFEKSESEKTRFIENFTDEYGNRRATDRPFLSHIFNVQSESIQSDALDEQLWWLTHSGNLTEAIALDLVEPSGPLVSDSENLAIEYRTMVELCSLHALWNYANSSQSSVLIDRCMNAVQWHIHELQPDNGINRPWGAHVFVSFASMSADPELSLSANLHAQTLVHNTSVTLGYPDRLSALILKDVSHQLQVHNRS